MTEIDAVGWAYWDPGTLEWRLAGSEPMAYYEREPVVRLSTAVALVKAQASAAERERDAAMQALAEYSSHLDEVLEELRAARARLEGVELGSVTAPIPDLPEDDEPEPTWPDDDSPFQTLPGWIERRHEAELDAAEAAGMEF